MSENNVSITWMMWQIDNAQKSDPPQLNLIRAIEFYTNKYNGVPNLAKLPEQWGEEIKPPDGMTIVLTKTIRVGQLMLAIDENNQKPIPKKGKKKK